MMYNALSLPAREAVERGVAAVSAIDNRWLRCDIKATALLANVLLLQSWRAAGGVAARPLALGFVTAGALGVLACSHYLLPAMQFFAESSRPMAPDLGRLSQSTFEWYGFLGYLAPDLFGRCNLAGALPYDHSPLPLLLGNRSEYGGLPQLPNFNSMEYAVFAGAFALWLAAVGIADR